MEAFELMLVLEGQKEVWIGRAYLDLDLFPSGQMPVLHGWYQLTENSKRIDVEYIHTGSEDGWTKV
jgi:hypothetical protein